MSAGRVIRHAPLALALSLAIALPPGCRGCDDHAPGSAHRDRERVSDVPDRRAWEQAETMVREAGLCEAGAAGDRAERCRTACDLGHSNSCHVAGELSAAAGEQADALADFSRACDGGSGLGCEAAARARRAGMGGAPDAAVAAELDRRARFYLRVHCEQRHARSCLVLGRLYTTSRGGPADRGSSATFLGRACSLGLAEACAPTAPAR